jgi:phenylpyruvate tautomerase PptA (4-oxalocrotonate tautomerase family)
LKGVAAPDPPVNVRIYKQLILLRNIVPNYQFVIADDSPSSSRKAEIAEAITVAHRKVTRAPSGYVFVSFTEVPGSSLFISGEPTTKGRMTGIIRRGRSEELRKKLILALADAWSEAGNEPLDRLAIFLHEIPGFQAVEDGEILPEAWEDAEAILD